MGNLWFVRAIGCNVELTVEPNHTLPTNREKHSNRTEIRCSVSVRPVLVYSGVVILTHLSSEWDSTSVCDCVCGICVCVTLPLSGVNVSATV